MPRIYFVLRKSLLIAGILFLAILLCSSCLAFETKHTIQKYVYPRRPLKTRMLVGKVAASPTTKVSVGSDSDSDYSSIQDAIDCVPEDNPTRVIINIAAGTYKEKIDIPSNKPRITLKGAGKRKTTIVWHDNANSTGSTYTSATVSVHADYFEAHHIRFKNSAKKAKPGQEGAQAVALMIEGDKAKFDSCIFESSQDTLYDKSGRHLFKNSKIIGNIDMICGNGQSLYKHCELHSIANKHGGSFTAQQRENVSEASGFSFVHCNITGKGSNNLGRAWGSASRVVFSYTHIADIINQEQPWTDWNDSSRDETIFYGMYQCSGPGANSTNFPSYVHELTKEEARPFMSLDFIEGDSWD